MRPARTLLLALTLGSTLAGAGLEPPAPATPPTPSTPPTDGSKDKPDTQQSKDAVRNEQEALAPLPGPDEVLHCEAQKDLPREKIEFLGEEWDCELCLDAESRATGMGARRSFPKGTAMVFVHPGEQVLNYWMKDCLIDLDIVFVDATGRISAIHEAKRAPLRRKWESLGTYERRLPRYSSNRRVRFALEFPAGTVARLKPRMGSRISIDWSALAARAR